MKLLICTQKMDTNDSVLGFTHRWVLEFAKVYEEVVVVCLYKGVVDVPENVRVLSLGKEAGVSRIKYLRNFFAYIFTERRNYDHVFVHMSQVYVLLGAFIWRLWGKRVGFWYAHGHVPFSARVGARFSHTLFTSTEHGFPIALPKRVIVGQGIDVEQFRCERFGTDAEESKNVEQVHTKSGDNTAGRDAVEVSHTKEMAIVTVGRLSAIKNYEVLIEAVALLRERGRKAALTLIGGAETKDQKAYEASLRTLVREKNIEAHVHFEGPVLNHELRTHLCSADMFVNTGLTGSLDKVGLEAIAAGLPVLACNPAYADVFREFSDRLMFTKDDARELADTLEREHEAVDKAAVVDVLQERLRREHGLGELVGKIQNTLSLGQSAGQSAEQNIS